MASDIITEPVVDSDGTFTPPTLSEAMNERYEGDDDDDRRFIKKYLKSVRSLALSAPPPDSRSLESLLNDPAGQIDVDHFRRQCDDVITRLRARWPSFAGLPFERCLVREQATPEDTGGFHSAYGRGFDQFEAISYCVTLNPSIAPSVALRTLELLRGYVHDSIHAQTLKVFRRIPTDYLGASRPIYRYQYGINFRRPWGTSFSLPNLTDKAPVRINLNLLMDGVTMWLAADALRPEIDRVRREPLTDFETAVVSDIELQWEPEVLWPGATRFLMRVSMPTRSFVAYWGGEKLRTTLYDAMFTGELDALRRYFELSHAKPASWDVLFKSPAWDEDPTRPSNIVRNRSRSIVSHERPG